MGGTITDPWLGPTLNISTGGSGPPPQSFSTLAQDVNNSYMLQQVALVLLCLTSLLLLLRPSNEQQTEVVVLRQAYDVRRGYAPRRGSLQPAASSSTAILAPSAAETRSRNRSMLPARHTGDVELLSAAGCGNETDGARLGECSGAPCTATYVLLRMKGNGKFIAPGERGVVSASVAPKLRREQRVPLERLAWRVVSDGDVAGDWVRLQHLQSGKWLRMVPPGGKGQWVLRVERHAAAFGQQTHFRIDRGGGAAGAGAGGAGGGAEELVWLRARATGGYVNYRGENFVRGHGNQKRGGAWAAAGREQSSQMGLERIRAAALRADLAAWGARRRRCLAPIAPRCGGALLAAGMTRACHDHFAAAFCDAAVRAHAARPGVGWGGTPAHARLRWARLDCDKHASTDDFAFFHPEQARVLPPAAAASSASTASSASAASSAAAVSSSSAAAAAAPAAGAAAAAVSAAPPPPRRIEAGSVHCVAPTRGVLLLAVSDRPNKWLCFLLHTALLHGLRPAILGWDPAAWLGFGGKKRPWTFHLGAKLLLPLEYLRRCHVPNDTLVVFTDHDVIFQAQSAQTARSLPPRRARSAARGPTPLAPRFMRRADTTRSRKPTGAPRAAARGCSSRRSTSRTRATLSTSTRPSPSALPSATSTPACGRGPPPT